VFVDLFAFKPNAYIHGRGTTAIIWDDRLLIYVTYFQHPYLPKSARSFRSPFYLSNILPYWCFVFWWHAMVTVTVI